MKLNRFYFDQAISIDNALTTNQILHQLIKQLNEVVEYVNNFETDAHEYADNKVLELKNELLADIQELHTQIVERERVLREYVDFKSNQAETNSKNYTDGEIALLKVDYIQPIVDRIYNTIHELDERLNNKIDFVDIKLQNLINDVKNELLDFIKKGGAIYSAVDGSLSNPQDEFRKIVDIFSNTFGLTWNWFKTYYGEYDFERQNSVSSSHKKLFEDTSHNRNFRIYIVEKYDTPSDHNLSTVTVTAQNDYAKFNFKIPDGPGFNLKRLIINEQNYTDSVTGTIANQFLTISDIEYSWFDKYINDFELVLDAYGNDYDYITLKVVNLNADKPQMTYYGLHILMSVLNLTYNTIKYVASTLIGDTNFYGLLTAEYVGTLCGNGYTVPIPIEDFGTWLYGYTFIQGGDPKPTSYTMNTSVLASEFYKESED